MNPAQISNRLVDAASTTTGSGVPMLGSDPRPQRLAATWSVLATAAGLAWALAPQMYPFGPGDRNGEVSLLSGTTAAQAATLLLVVGPLGVALALLAGQKRWRGAAVIGGAVQAVGFGLLVPDVQLLILFAYLVTALAPLALAGLLITGAVRGSRLAGVTVAVLAVAVTAAVTTGAGGSAFAELGSGLLAAGQALEVRPLILLFFLAGGVVWAWTALTALRAGPAEAGWAHPERAARWGRWATYAAALGPLPYGVLRLTWLLPGMEIGAPDTLDAEPGLRLWGLMLGLAAIGGSVLTLGLVSRWGEVWPRGVPGLGGRPVPPRLPVVVGGAVAVLTTIGGVSLTKQSAITGDWLSLAALPLPIWGPLLGAAVLAYHLRRRSDRTHSVGHDRRTRPGRPGRPPDDPAGASRAGMREEMTRPLGTDAGGAGGVVRHRPLRRRAGPCGAPGWSR